MTRIQEPIQLSEWGVRDPVPPSRREMCGVWGGIIVLLVGWWLLAAWAGREFAKLIVGRLR